jgi:hypothetical protein
MTWTDGPIIYEDEDENALIDDFVKVAIDFPNHTHFDWAKEVFAKLRDPHRFQQAAVYWNNQLSIQKRITEGKRRKPSAKFDGIVIETKEDLQAAILANIYDETITATEKKVRGDQLLYIAEINGWKIKAIDKKINSDERVTHIVNVRRHSDIAN